MIINVFLKMQSHRVHKRYRIDSSNKAMAAVQCIACTIKMNRSRIDNSVGPVSNTIALEALPSGRAHTRYAQPQRYINAFHQSLFWFVMEETKSCAVCGDSSDGIHFRVESCRACAAFFRRTIALNRVYVCQHQDNCAVDKCACSFCFIVVSSFIT